MPKAKSKRKPAKSKRKPRRPRPYKLDKKSRAKHKYRKRRHKKSRVTGHRKRARDEAELTNYLLHQLLKTADEEDYHFHPRHASKDPEYQFSSPALQEFKDGFPAPDVNFWRPQGTDAPPHHGNFPNWRPEWVHTYQHPHAGN